MTNHEQFLQEQRKRLFLEDLSKLLKKHKVAIECKDYWQGYTECGGDVRMTAIFDGEYTGKYGYCCYDDLDLGCYLNGDCNE